MDYDGRQHTVYARARALPPETITQLTAAIAGHAPARRPLTVLDLGSGTGRVTPALADEFGGPACGVEPSSRMRAIAKAAAAHPAVTYLRGAAADIPLADAACDLALRGISTFERLTPAETAAGFAALDRAVTSEDNPTPIYEYADLTVLTSGLTEGLTSG